MKRPKESRAKPKAKPQDQLDLFQPRISSVLEAYNVPELQLGSLRDQINSSKKPRGIAACPPVTAAKEKTGVTETLVDTSTAARRLGIGVSTLEKMRSQRRGPPFVKLAKNVVRYRLHDLDEWVSGQVQR